MQDQELILLTSMARAARMAGGSDVEHLDGAAAAFNYIRIANLVTSYCRARGIDKPVLDWGCGYGQVTWLLRRRSVEVASCDAQKREGISSIPDLAAIPISYLKDPVRLPYGSGSFSAVLSVGVLEHVTDLRGSLLEIHRVLQPEGLFFLFMFPNRFSWAEWAGTIRGISVHPLKFTFRETRDLLRKHGFQVTELWRRNLLPRNLTGMSHRAKSLYGRYYRQIDRIDRALCSIPPIAWFSGVLELIAERREVPSNCESDYHD